MEYVLLIQSDEAAYAALDEETGKRMYAEHFAFMDEVRAAGVAIPYSAELDHVRTARISTTSPGLRGIRRASASASAASAQSTR